MEIVMTNKNGQELATSLFSGCLMCSEVFFLICGSSPDHFRCHNEGGFRVFPKFTIDNLCKTFQVVIIIPFPTFC